jgi:DNA topoisomerase-1
MAKYLVVVESPAKAKTINKFLGPNYLVRASMGHVRDLPKSEMGVDLEHNFEPKYVRLRDSSKAIKAIQEAAAKADTILLATDPDREGEAIGWHVAEILKKENKPIRRIVFNAITKRNVKEAANNPRDLDMNVVNAQQARRILDRIVGYKLSPLLQWRIRKGLSAGRVQSVAVRMVVDRENEIRAFIIEEYWTLDATFLTPDRQSLKARLNRIRGDKPQLPNEETVKEIMAALQSGAFAVEKVEKKESQRRPYPPFITSSLQQEGSRKLRFSPRKTMRVAQQLYEGINIGSEGTVGLITYMRTDSTRLESEALDDVRGYIAKSFEPAMLPEKPNVYPSKKGSQDAHEAIRPTESGRTPEAVAQYLDKDQLALYKLIWQRFVACQMTPARYDQTAIDIVSGDYTFRATGSIMKFAGFTKLYEETEDDPSVNGEQAAEGKGNRLPDVAEGTALNRSDWHPEQHFTKPPPRYTEASLIRALEENGIGRPSTYAPTINTISERGYVEREQGRLTPTELGEEVDKILREHFSEIVDLGFTARMEEDLDRVEEGQREWHEVLRVFYNEFDADLSKAQNKMVREVVDEDPICPTCNAPMELREGRFGMFIACKHYPECKTTKRIEKSSVEETDQVCESCGAKMVIRLGRFGRFMACSNYPKCKTTHNVDEKGNKVDTPAKEPPRKTEQKCPDCGAFLLIRKNRRGEEFYGCEKYPKCKYTRPMELNLACPRSGCEGQLVQKMAKRRRFIGCDKYPACDFTIFGAIDKSTPCPQCGNEWTIVRRSRGNPDMRACPVPTCKYEEELVEEKT